jgi:hypothetical protein
VCIVVVVSGEGGLRNIRGREDEDEEGSKSVDVEDREQGRA